MSRIGKKPIDLPSGVKVDIKGRLVNISGPKGSLSWECPEIVSASLSDDGKQIVVDRKGEDSRCKALHGLSRSLIANMVEGVEKGYEKKLELYGTGYSANVKGQKLLLNCGYMGRGLDQNGKQKEAQFTLDIPQGVTVTVETPNARGNNEPAKFTISGADKQTVGQFAAEIRMIRKPEPYLGKGFRFAGEQIRRKQGKAFASGG